MAVYYVVRCQDESLYTGIAHDVGKRRGNIIIRRKTGAKVHKKPSGDSSGDGLADGNMVRSCQVGISDQTASKKSEGSTDPGAGTGDGPVWRKTAGYGLHTPQRFEAGRFCWLVDAEMGGGKKRKINLYFSSFLRF